MTTTGTGAPTSAPGPRERAEALRPDLEDLYRDLHAHPELSFQEERTAALAEEHLAALGYETHRVGGGVVGLLRRGDGPTVLLRADMDALPVPEDTGLPYASTATATTADGETVPVMHACGHDVHVTALLGAARLLAEVPAWHGTLELVLQPAEELGAGARAMLDDGLAGHLPAPDVALAQHVLGVTPAGTVALRPGPVLSTAAALRVTVHGVGTHGSMPHLGVDPVVTAAAIVLRLRGLVSRETAPGEFAVVTVGAIHAGTTANTVPESAELLVSVRAYSGRVRERLLAGIRRVVTAECEAAGCPVPPDLELTTSFPLTTNDAAATDRAAAALIDALGADKVGTLEPQTASEDFSLITTALGAPYVYWGLGGFTDPEAVRPNHSPQFAPAIEPTLVTGTTALAATALAWLAAPADG